MMVAPSYSVYRSRLQKGVDEDEISVSIGDREDNAIVEGISFNSCLSFFQADEVG